MDVRNCRSCGKLFNYMGGGVSICPVCERKLEDKFAEVKRYIYDNPGAGIQVVAEVNEVSMQQIKKWVREERLCFSEDSQVGLECESCGTTIKTGRFCQACKDKMVNSLGSIYREPDKSQLNKKNPGDGTRMRFFDE